MKTAKDKTFKIQLEISSLTGMGIYLKKMNHNSLDSLTRMEVDEQVWDLLRPISNTILWLPLSVDVTSDEQESQ